VSNAIAIAALVVSLGVGYFTLYQQFWKKPNLSVVLGELGYLAYLPNKAGLEIYLAVTILSDGATDAAVTRITGHLAPKDASWETFLTWLYFVKAKATPGLWTWSWAIQDATSSIVVPSRKTVTKWVNFISSTTSLEIGEAEYELQIQLEGPDRSTAASKSYHFSITPEDRDYLDQNCVPLADGTLMPALPVRILEPTTPITDEDRLPIPSAETAEPQAQPDAPGQ
jgi:hypothetical protein